MTDQSLQMAVAAMIPMAPDATPLQHIADVLGLDGTATVYGLVRGLQADPTFHVPVGTGGSKQPIASGIRVHNIGHRRCIQCDPRVWHELDHASAPRAAYICPNPVEVDGQIGRLPLGTWISMTYRPKRRATTGKKRPCGWMGKIQCDGKMAPRRSLWTRSSLELVCRLPGLWLEMHGEHNDGLR